MAGDSRRGGIDDVRERGRSSVVLCRRRGGREEEWVGNEGGEEERRREGTRYRLSASSTNDRVGHDHSSSTARRSVRIGSPSQSDRNTRSVALVCSVLPLSLSLLSFYLSLSLSLSLTFLSLSPSLSPSIPSRSRTLPLPPVVRTPSRPLLPSSAQREAAVLFLEQGASSPSSFPRCAPVYAFSRVKCEVKLGRSEKGARRSGEAEEGYIAIRGRYTRRYVRACLCVGGVTLDVLFSAPSWMS